jgi:hypothetical protein
MKLPVEVRATITPLVITEPPLELSAELAACVRSSVKSSPPVPPVPVVTGRALLLLLHDTKKGAKITVPADTPRTEKKCCLFIFLNLTINQY